MASLGVIRAEVEKRLPGALTVYRRSAIEIFPTGLAILDEQIGGIPGGALTQICAPGDISSGRTTLLVSLMAQVTRRGQFCALVDASDGFDPISAEAAGVDLSRLLWVRCGISREQGLRKKRLRPLEQAFKAADILVQNGGFSVIAVDLSAVDERQVNKIPLTTWFRFARVMERTPSALVFLTPYPAAQSCAGLTLHLSCAKPGWTPPTEVSHGRLLTELNFEAEIGRARLRKPVQSARPRFSASSLWG